MKKTFVMFFMLVVTVCASAQIVVMNNTNVVRLDMDGDGIWDQEVNVGRIPGISYVRTERNFYSELGRVYIINQWQMYERQGVNPAQYLPDPASEADFSAYAGYYARYIGGMMGGMVAPMGMPGNASISVGGKNFGFGISVPVRNANSGYGYTPNASVGVSVNGNHFGASIPVTIVTGGKKAKAQKSIRQQPTRRSVQSQPQTQTRSQQPIRVVREMTVDEVSQMMNNNDYM